MKGMTHTQRLLFWCKWWNYLLCALFCSCCIWLTVNRNMRSSASFSFHTYQTDFCEIKIGSEISGRSTRWMPTSSRQNGKCGQTEATAACYEHLVAPLATYRLSCLRSANLQVRELKACSLIPGKISKKREEKGRIKLCTDVGSVQCACQSKHFHSTNNLFWIVCVYCLQCIY